MIEAKAVKGDPFYLHDNKQKTAANQPDNTGNMKLTGSQLQALIEIYKRAQAENEEPVLQIDFSGWQRQSKDTGKPYVYCKSEVWTGKRRKKQANNFDF